MNLRAILILGMLICGWAAVSGCAKNEHKEVRVEQRQVEGDPEPVAPGEMIVE